MAQQPNQQYGTAQQSSGYNPAFHGSEPQSLQQSLQQAKQEVILASIAWGECLYAISHAAQVAMNLQMAIAKCGLNAVTTQNPQAFVELQQILQQWSPAGIQGNGGSKQQQRENV